MSSPTGLFYGESGGQVGDRGVMTVVGGEGRITITETQKKPGDVIVHVGQVAAREIRVGSAVHLAIDSQFRVAVRADHSATHLLHAALRRRLGEHVTQKGSFVSADRFRLIFRIRKPSLRTTWHRLSRT